MFPRCTPSVSPVHARCTPSVILVHAACIHSARLAPALGLVVTPVREGEHALRERQRASVQEQTKVLGNGPSLARMSTHEAHEGGDLVALLQHDLAVVVSPRQELGGDGTGGEREPVERGRARSLSPALAPLHVHRLLHSAHLRHSSAYLARMAAMSRRRSRGHWLPRFTTPPPGRASRPPGSRRQRQGRNVPGRRLTALHPPGRAPVAWAWLCAP